MNIPKTQEEWMEIARAWGWTAGLVLLGALICWQGLTLHQYMRSWQAATDRVQTLLGGGASIAAKNAKDEPGQEARKVEATFFHRPSPAYTLSAILGGYAVINGKELRVGDRIEKAVIEKIDTGAVTIREDGSSAARDLVLHPGP